MRRASGTGTVRLCQARPLQAKEPAPGLADRNYMTSRRSQARSVSISVCLSALPLSALDQHDVTGRGQYRASGLAAEELLVGIPCLG